jgi:hypothetical protein
MSPHSKKFIGKRSVVAPNAIFGSHRTLPPEDVGKQLLGNGKPQRFHRFSIAIVYGDRDVPTA